MNRDPAAWSRLGSIIRETRNRRGLSQDELAARAEVSSRSVQGAESGRMPQGRMPQSLAGIGKALGWPPGTVKAVLDGGLPPGWAEREERPLLNAEELKTIVENAILKATDNVTTAELRNVTALVVDELRQLGLVAD